MPTHIFLVVAPINILLNYLLVLSPTRLALGFIGAPVSAVIRCEYFLLFTQASTLISQFSMNLIAIFSVIYGITWVPNTAWHPLSKRSFQRLGVVTRLGLATIGQAVSEWWSWEILVCEFSSFYSTTDMFWRLYQLLRVSK